MRMRSALLAAVSVCGLGVVGQGTAAAADGAFTYRFPGADGQSHWGGLTDPPSGECLDLPEVIEFYDTYAFRPYNRTDSTATVFKSGNCQGEAASSLRAGDRASSRLLIRSVRFG